MQEETPGKNPMFPVDEIKVRFSGLYYEVIGVQNACSFTAATLRVPLFGSLDTLRDELKKALESK